MGTHHTCVHVVKGYTKEEQGARGNSLWCIELTRCRYSVLQTTKLFHSFRLNFWIHHTPMQSTSHLVAEIKLVLTMAQVIATVANDMYMKVMCGAELAFQRKQRRQVIPKILPQVGKGKPVAALPQLLPSRPRVPAPLFDNVSVVLDDLICAVHVSSRVAHAFIA
jgi:hypothetical protein